MRVKDSGKTNKKTTKTKQIIKYQQTFLNGISKGYTYELRKMTSEGTAQCKK